MVIYWHSTVITKVMLPYNTEWLYDHGMVVNYRGKKFYNIDTQSQSYKYFPHWFYKPDHFSSHRKIVHKYEMV